MDLPRKRYVDILRIVAIFLVIFNHLPGYTLYQNSSGVKQFIYMIITMVTRINVPMFFMISGALLLGKTETFSEILKKRVSRFVAVICIFGAGIYTEYYIIRSVINDIEFEFSLKRYIRGMLEGNLDGCGSYWFIYAYLGFLFMLPFLQRIAKELTNWDFWGLVILHFLFYSLLPFVNILLDMIGYNKISITSSFLVPLATIQSVFYPLLGYYIDKKIDISKIKLSTMIKLAITALGGMLLSCFCTYYEKGQTGTYSQNYVQMFDYLTTIVIFLWVKYIFTQKTMILEHPKAKIITKISSLTFGMYLLDPYIKSLIYQKYNLFAEALMPTLVVSLLWCVISMLVGGCITVVLTKLPILKKIL